MVQSVRSDRPVVSDAVRTLRPAAVRRGPEYRGLPIDVSSSDRQELMNEELP